LAVFAGGWTLEAAEAVCAGNGIEDWEVLDLLTSLVDKSLVVADEHDGQARYRLHETMRQYAHDRLHESGDAAGARGLHRDWCLALAEESDQQLGGTTPMVWLEAVTDSGEGG
jgi:non-specific serine/threonine protein kinase